jgi:hypothetical protein
MTRNGGSWRRRARSVGVCAAVALAAQALVACTGVASTTPWFGPADAAGSPRLREGVWRLAQPADKPCPAFDETRPLDAWPDCAMGLVVTASEIKAMHRGDGGRTETEAFPYVLAAGDPPILQLADTSEATTGYLYVWLQPTKRGADGRVVELRGWRVLCGPPAPPDGSQTSLYPGLTPSNGDCVATSRDALRAAAKASQHDDATDVTDIRWIRAGDR